MDTIELGYAKEIWLGDKQVAYVYLGDKVVYPAIIGYEEKTEYTDWVYTITVDRGSRERSWTKYKRAKYGNGTFSEWELIDNGVDIESGTQSTSEVNTSAWTYAITFDTGYRTQTYQIRYTYTFSDATQYADSTVQSRTQHATRTTAEFGHSGWSYSWAFPANGSTRTQSYYVKATYTFPDGTVSTADSAIQYRTESGANGVAVVKLKLVNIPTWTLPANGASIAMNIQVDYIWGGVVIQVGNASNVSATSSNGGIAIESPLTVLNLSRGNNTSTNPQTVTFQIHRPDLTSSDVYTFTQAAGVQVFGTPIVTGFGYPDIPAAGGTVSPNVYNWYQPWTWNGVAGSGGNTTSGGVAIYSNGTGQVSAGSKGTTASDRTHVYTMTTRVDANGVTGQNASANVYQAANTRWQASTQCSGYTYIVNWAYSSGATSQDQYPNSSACGYIAPHFNLVARLNTDWSIVQNKVGTDHVNIEFDCGPRPEYLPLKVIGEWNAFTNEVSDTAKDYTYASGGAHQGGPNGIRWVGPAYITITNPSGGLVTLHWNYELPSGAGATADIVVSGNYM